MAELLKAAVFPLASWSNEAVLACMGGILGVIALQFGAAYVRRHGA